MQIPEDEGLHSDSPPSSNADKASNEIVARMDLAGSGRNFLWTAVPTGLTLISGIFLLSFSIRIVGRTEYGAMVAIASATSILTLFSFGLRFSVVRSAARASSLGKNLDEGPEAPSIRAAHTLFVVGSLALLLAGAGLGWLIPLDLGMHGTLAFHVYLASIIAISGSSLTLAVTAFSGIVTSQEQFRLGAIVGISGSALQVALTVALARPLHILGLAIALFGSSLLQSVMFAHFGRRKAPWLGLRPRFQKATVVMPVLRYASGIALLSATSTICAASDAFVLGAFGGGAFITTFRVGSIAPLSLVGIMYLSFGVLFPRLVRNPDRKVQEEGIGWLGRIIGWTSGAVFGCLCLAGSDLVRVLYGRSNMESVHVMWICAAALCVDVSYHGVVQTMFARGQQGILAKYTWIELILNLSATIVGVKFFGPLGSALALAITIFVTDIVGFPIIARGRWGSLPGRFVLSHGVVQSAAGGLIAVGIGIVPILMTSGIFFHLLITMFALIVSVGSGFAFLNTAGRSRVFDLFMSRKTGPSLSE
jgi:O-antigen/teichoic acid export membrane protein